MTDQTIPADDLRGFIARYRTAANGQGSILLDELEALIPPPPRPTLADMTEEERRACQWMQADVKDRGGRYVIANPDDGEGDAGMVSAYGGIDWIFPEYVTPRPDLPRMEWPGNEKPAPAPALPDGWRLADHEDYGRVIVTNPTPARDGRVYFVIPAVDPLGVDWLFCTPDELAYIDQGPPMPLIDDQAEGHANDRWSLPLHRTEAGYPNCSTCDGGGCPDCTDPAQ